MPGIDALWIGLYDMTNSMGIPGQMQHRDTLAAIDRVLAACKTHHKIPAVLVTSIPEGQSQLQRGFKMIAYSGDLWLYQAALRHGIKSLKTPS